MEDLYGDLAVDHSTHRVAELEMEVAALRQELAENNVLVNSLKTTVQNLQSNVSCLYLTASQELKRKDAQIDRLRSSKFTR
jgi:hypothetical protein